MSASSPPRVHLGGEAQPDPRFRDAVVEGGGRLSPADEAEAVVWLGSDPDELRALLHEGVRWVQLHSAGAANYVEAGVVTDARTVTSAAGAFADAVAEHAVALALAGLRRLHRYARTQDWAEREDMRTLLGSTVAIVGAGGIGRAVIGFLQPFDVRVLAVNRSGDAVPGAQQVLAQDAVEKVWDEADVIVLAAPETPATRHMVGARELAAMRPEAVLVNVGRGTLIDTAALVEALAEERIGCAVLDVTEPEPLPDDHPLWREPRCLITPHVANFPQARAPALARRIRENVERFAAGEPLVAEIDPDRGY